MSVKVTNSPDGTTRADSGATPGEEGANVMWGGRFAAGPAEIMQRINASIGFDRRLYAQDIAASKAHCEMLVRQGIVSTEGRV